MPNTSEIMQLQKLSGMENFKKLTIPQFLEREKLIELIGSTEYGNGSLIGNNFQKGFIEKIADHLIANGVTVQQWISVSERLPDGECLAISMKKGAAYKEQWIGWVSKDEITDEYVCEQDGVFLPNVTHWMPLPEPPKGE